MNELSVFGGKFKFSNVILSLQLPTQTAAQPPAAAKRAADDGSGDGPDNNGDTPDESQETPASSSETTTTASPPPAKRTRNRVAKWLNFIYLYRGPRLQ